MASPIALDSRCAYGQISGRSLAMTRDIACTARRLLPYGAPSYGEPEDGPPSPLERGMILSTVSPCLTPSSRSPIPLTDSIVFPLVWERIPLLVPMRRFPGSLPHRRTTRRTSG
jgi:hypothetical protein